MKHVKGKLTAVLGAAAGYVLGSRAGRERYEQIKNTASGVWNNPKVQEKVQAAETVAKDTAQSAAGTVKDTVKDKVSSNDASADGPAADEVIRPS